MTLVRSTSYFLAEELDFFDPDGNEIPTTASTGSPYCSTEYDNGNYACSKAFNQAAHTGTNGMVGTYWHSASEPPACNLDCDLSPPKLYVGWHFNTPTVVTSYEYVSNGYYSAGSYEASAWYFEGSNDGSTWDILDSPTGLVWTNRQQRVMRNELTCS